MHSRNLRHLWRTYRANRAVGAALTVAACLASIFILARLGSQEQTYWRRIEVLDLDGNWIYIGDGGSWHFDEAFTALLALVAAVPDGFWLLSPWPGRVVRLLSLVAVTPIAIITIANAGRASLGLGPWHGVLLGGSRTFPYWIPPAGVPWWVYGYENWTQTEGREVITWPAGLAMWMAILATLVCAGAVLQALRGGGQRSRSPDLVVRDGPTTGAETDASENPGHHVKAVDTL